MKFFNIIRMMKAIIIVFLSMPCTTYASTYLGATRLVIDEKTNEATLRVVNDGTASVLIKSWIDVGDKNASPEKIIVPFTIAKPILRLDSKQSKLLQVLFTGDSSTLPDNKESIFWLNVLEIPQKSVKQSNDNQLQLAFRSRIKIFYRPKKIIDIDTKDIHEKLIFKLKHQPREYLLEVINPTAFYQTLNSIHIYNKQEKVTLTKHTKDYMVPPHGKINLLVSNVNISSHSDWFISYSVIDEFGNVLKKIKELN